jgi:pathogenesis-related protein 1
MGLGARLFHRCDLQEDVAALPGWHCTRVVPAGGQASAPSFTPNPALPTLTWSTAAAATWADQCQFKHNPNLGNFGENIAAATANSLTTMGVVQSWASESAYYDYGTNSCAGGQTCGHYTQIVWRNTTQVGCAMARCNQNSPFGGSTQWWFWVCDYSPPGNFVGQRPY